MKHVDDFNETLYVHELSQEQDQVVDDFEQLYVPESTYHEHQEALFTGELERTSSGRYILDQLETTPYRDFHDHRSIQFTPQEIETIASCESKEDVAKLKFESYRGNVVAERIWLDAQSHYDDLMCTKTSYEMRRGNTSDACRYAREVGQWGNLLALFKEAAKLGELEVLAELGDIRQEAETRQNTQLLFDYLLTEIELGWNIETNADAVEVLITDPQLHWNAVNNLSRYVESLIRGNELERAWQTLQNTERFVYNKFSDDAYKALRSKIWLEKASKGELGTYHLRHARRTVRKLAKGAASSYPKHTINGGQIDDIIIVGLTHPANSKLTKVLKERASSVYSLSEGHHKKYLRQIDPDNWRSKERYAITASGIKLALENNQPQIAEEYYLYSISRGEDNYELLKMSMELALRTGSLSNPEDEAVTNCLAKIELITADYLREKRHITPDLVDQSRFRQKHNLELANVFHTVKTIQDPLGRFRALSKLMQVQQEHDVNAPSWQHMQAGLGNAAKSCLDSKIIRMSITQEELEEICQKFGVEMLNDEE